MAVKNETRGSGMRGLLIGALVVMALSVALVIFLDFYTFLRTPGPGSDKNLRIRVTVEPGMTFDKVARLLHKEGIIGDIEKFGWLAMIKRASTRIKAGEFEFESTMTPQEVMDILVSGKSVEYRITIPEGYNLVQIAGILDEGGMWSGQKFLDLALSSSFAGRLDVQADSLEGYIYPDTYQFPRWADEEDIIRAMVKKMDKVFGREYRDRMNEMEMTMHEILTLASLIEKETSVPEERALISSVFHHRLEKGMKLECDPTVIYGMPNFNGNLRRKDLETWTPYNTYLNHGLPPGPIASPGRDSVHAALYPDKTNYLFFVSKGDGTHYFSSTYREHREAVRRYQMRGR